MSLRLSPACSHSSNARLQLLCPTRITQTATECRKLHGCMQRFVMQHSVRMRLQPQTTCCQVRSGGCQSGILRRQPGVDGCQLRRLSFSKLPLLLRGAQLSLDVLQQVRESTGCAKRRTGVRRVVALDVDSGKRRQWSGGSNSGKQHSLAVGATCHCLDLSQASRTAPDRCV